VATENFYIIIFIIIIIIIIIIIKMHLRQPIKYCSLIHTSDNRKEPI